METQLLESLLLKAAELQKIEIEIYAKKLSLKLYRHLHRASVKEKYTFYKDLKKTGMTKEKCRQSFAYKAKAQRASFWLSHAGKIYRDYLELLVKRRKFLENSPPRLELLFFDTIPDKNAGENN